VQNLSTKTCCWRNDGGTTDKMM